MQQTEQQPCQFSGMKATIKHPAASLPGSHEGSCVGGVSHLALVLRGSADSPLNGPPVQALRDARTIEGLRMNEYRPALSTSDSGTSVDASLVALLYAARGLRGFGDG